MTNQQRSFAGLASRPSDGVGLVNSAAAVQAGREEQGHRVLGLALLPCPPVVGHIVGAGSGALMRAERVPLMGVAVHLVVVGVGQHENCHGPTVGDQIPEFPSPAGPGTQVFGPVLSVARDVPCGTFGKGTT